MVTTKNVPDISPTVPEIIAPAVTEAHTTIVLAQNGLNIEKPLIAAFPQNVVLSGVSLIGATETQRGSIVHDDHDELIIGPFDNPNIPPEAGTAAAKKFVDVYNASGKVDCVFNANVGYIRWRKLVYNACYNSVCTITRMDTSRMRIAKHPIENVIRPLMWEIWHTAKAAGYQLADDQVEKTVVADPFDTFFKPSMQQDIEKVCTVPPVRASLSDRFSKGNFIEFENIVGEPMREAERLGVPTPNLKLIYGLLKTLQWKTQEQKGLITLPPIADLK